MRAAAAAGGALIKAIVQLVRQDGMDDDDRLRVPAHGEHEISPERRGVLRGVSSGRSNAGTTEAFGAGRQQARRAEN